MSTSWEAEHHAESLTSNQTTGITINSLERSNTYWNMGRDWIISPKGLAHACIGLYGLGFTLQMAMLPYIVLELGAPLATNGYVLGLFALLQLFGGILFGRIADYYGPKKGFQVALGSSALLYTMLAISTAPWHLYVSIIPGILAHGFLAAAIIICYITKPEDRTPAIAYLSISYGIGMIVGGLFGAILTALFSPRGVLICSAVVQIAGCAMSYRFDVFDSLQPIPSDKRSQHGLEWVGNEFKRMWHLFLRCQSLCYLLFIGLIPVLMARFAFVPIGIQHFALSSGHASYLIAYIGVATIVSEGIIVPWMSKTLGDMACNRISVLICTIGFGLLAIFESHEMAIVLLLFLPLCGGACLYMCTTGLMTKKVGPSDFGSVLGMNGAIYYLVAGFAPVLAIYIYSLYGLTIFWIVCSSISALVSMYVWAVDPYTTESFVSGYDDAKVLPISSH